MWNKHVPGSICVVIKLLYSVCAHEFVQQAV